MSTQAIRRKSSVASPKERLKAKQNNDEPPGNDDFSSFSATQPTGDAPFSNGSYVPMSPYSCAKPEYRNRKGGHGKHQSFKKKILLNTANRF